MKLTDWCELAWIFAPVVHEQVRGSVAMELAGWRVVTIVRYCPHNETQCVLIETRTLSLGLCKMKYIPSLFPLTVSDQMLTWCCIRRWIPIKMMVTIHYPQCHPESRPSLLSLLNNFSSLLSKEYVYKLMIRFIFTMIDQSYMFPIFTNNK